MMELFAQQGWVCSGVEPVGRLRDDVGSRGFTVYAALEDVPCVPSYDAITFIDSLYYLLEPCLALSRASSMLTSGGVIVVRIANRTPPLRLLRTLRSWRRFADVFSDQIAAISHEGMQAMAHAAGLHVSLLCLREARPVIGRPVAQTWLLYRVVGPLAALTGLRLSPGIIYVLHKARQEDGQHVAARQDGPRVHERSVYYGTDMSQP
jgi:hypothetical protein